MAAADTEIPEVIRLQLRKPKSWNWELSTSKSSPNIVLPIIQLFDYKGQLLVEATDNGNALRRCWSSSNHSCLTNCSSNSARRRKSSSNSVKRSRSDTVFKDRHIAPTEKQYQNELEGEPEKKGDLSNPRQHRRSRSDDMFRRKLIPTKESMRRAEQDGYKNFLTTIIPEVAAEETEKKQKKIRRIYSAEIISNGNTSSNTQVSDVRGKKYITRTSKAGTLLLCEDESFLQKSSGKRSRQASKEYPIDNAESPIYNGTDVDGARGKTYHCHLKNICDPHKGRCGEKKEKGSERSRSNPWANQRNPADPLDRKELRYSHSIGKFSQHHRDGNVGISKENKSFPLENGFSLAEGRTPTCQRNKCQNKCKCETLFVKNGREIHSNGALIENNKKKKKRGGKLQIGDGVMDQFFDGFNNRQHHKKGHVLKEHSPKKTTIGAVTDEKDSAASSCDLLRLVRKLSTTTTSSKTSCDASAANEAVTDNTSSSLSKSSSSRGTGDSDMGANVSRHSTKGLGRRSQSSGSICNGKGRRSDGKICSSLPNYLDDRQDGGGSENGCNNNHHEFGEKVGIDEVDRIPPLGDAGPGLHWKFSESSQTTSLCLADQGYGSERSPEEEYPPSLPGEHHLQCHRHLEPHACYPFITPESTFLVKLTKGSRGLGLSVTGGIESGGSWPGLIRIKRLFPHQPASSCGMLNVGDLLLEANGVPLTGLTNYEALEVLRTSTNQVELKVCRPPPDVLNCVSPISEVPPPPPRREQPNTLGVQPAIYSTPEDDYYHGEYEITLKKIQGSLGFTLRKEDDSALGHYVRALVREPALTDCRIRAGDKIIAVNDVELCHMSHEQAVQFLRQCPEVVKLRLYRDSAQTPVATLSPSETTPRSSFSKKGTLRQEAVDMLNDIAAGRILASINPEMYNRSLSSPSGSPRRLHRQGCPTETFQATDTEQFHEGLLQKVSHPFDDDAFNSLFSMESDDGDKPSRPSSLDLYNPNQTPVATRKPRFNFSLAHNAYELNNLDPEVLDAPNLTYNLGNEESTSVKPDSQEPMSMPHISVNNPTFSYKNPAYQSAHPQISSDMTEVASNNSNSNSTTASTKPMTSKSDNGSNRSKDKPQQQPSQEAKGRSLANYDNNQAMHIGENYEVLAIELNRGWNSRLGFSLQGAAGVTYVSAVHADSVAAKDGRLKPGDRLIKVNDESIEHMTTSEIIDLLRIVRGPVCIVVSRVKSNEDCEKSNATN